MIQHIKRYAKKKSVIGLFSIAAVTGTIVGIQHVKAPVPTQYILAAVTKETVVVSVKGSGQVSGQNQLDIKPEVSGTVMKILVKPGEEVKSGTVLFEIDRKVAVKAVRDASQSVRDARISLEASRLSLSKLKQPPDPVALVQAQNALNQAKRDLEKVRSPNTYDLAQARAELDALLQNIRLSADGKTPNAIRNAYDDAVPILKTVSQALQTSLYDADAVLGIDNLTANDAYERLLSVTDSTKLLNATASYPGAKQSVLALKLDTDALASSNEDTAKIDAALADAQKSLALMEPLLQNVYDALLATLTSTSFSQTALASLQNTIQSDRTSVSSKLASITSQLQAIEQSKTAFLSAQLNVQKSQNALDKLLHPDPRDIAAAEEKVAAAEASLAKLVGGSDPIDVALAENSLAQRQSSLESAQNKLADAQETLNAYSVRAPFDGVVARIVAQEATQAGPGSVMATLLTRAKIAQITLNEVDAGKARVGEKATLAFDAIPELNIAGIVSEIDPLGTVMQGVVNYSVKIAFETQDDRVRPGMSVSAAVVTDVKTDALAIPNSAVHQEGGATEVQVLKNPKPEGADQNAAVTSDAPPDSRVVQIGLANDEVTEIVSGLNEGDRVIVRTIDPAAQARAKQTQSSSSGTRLPGFGGGGFGGVRTGGGSGGR